MVGSQWIKANGERKATSLDRDMKNSERFLNAFNAIESHLSHTTELGPTATFHELMEKSRFHSHVIQSYRDDLRDFADLRNLLVHKRVGDHLMAEPTDEAVARLEHISKALLEPPKIIPSFQREVLWLHETEPIGHAVRQMLLNDYSQIPTYEDREFKGLLTANTIARWLGATAAEDLVSLDSTTIAQVITFTEDRDICSFIARDATIFDASERFLRYQHTGKRLEALLITQSGRESERLLGIITPWDLPRLFEEINHPPSRG